MAKIQNKMLIYHSKANFDVALLFGKGTHTLDQEIRKRLVISLQGSKNSSFHRLSNVILFVDIRANQIYFQSD